MDVVSTLLEIDSPIDFGKLLSVQSIRPKKYIMQIVLNRFFAFL